MYHGVAGPEVWSFKPVVKSRERRVPHAKTVGTALSDGTPVQSQSLDAVAWADGFASRPGRSDRPLRGGANNFYMAFNNCKIILTDPKSVDPAGQRPLCNGRRCQKELSMGCQCPLHELVVRTTRATWAFAVPTAIGRGGSGHDPTDNAGSGLDYTLPRDTAGGGSPSRNAHQLVVSQQRVGGGAVAALPLSAGTPKRLRPRPRRLRAERGLITAVEECGKREPPTRDR